MTNKKLKQSVIDKIHAKTGLAESTIRSNISHTRTEYPSCTINAAAQLYARKLGMSVMQKLSAEDKKSLPHNEMVNPKIKIDQVRTRSKKKITPIIDYETDDYFKRGHIREINKAYSNGCYTSVYALGRKIIENLIREILSNKYPPNTRENKELYFDIGRNRVHDFSVVLKNLYDKRQEFGIDKSPVIKRLYQLAKPFKDDSNDKVHSWYHLVERKNEIDDLNIQTIIELIKKLEMH